MEIICLLNFCLFEFQFVSQFCNVHLTLLPTGSVYRAWECQSLVPWYYSGEREPQLSVISNCKCYL